MSLSHRRPDTWAFHTQDLLQRAHTCAIDTAHNQPIVWFPLVTCNRCESPVYLHVIVQAESGDGLFQYIAPVNGRWALQLWKHKSCWTAQAEALYWLVTSFSLWAHFFWIHFFSFFLIFYVQFEGLRLLEFVSPVSQRTNEKSSIHFACLHTNRPF